MSRTAVNALVFGVVGGFVVLAITSAVACGGLYDGDPVVAAIWYALGSTMGWWRRGSYG